MAWPTVLSVFASGLPAQKGSMKPIPSASTRKCLCVPDNGPALRRWEKAVADAARDALTLPAHRGAPFGPVGVECHFWLPRPATVSRYLPTVPPDVDKLTRAVLDALKKAGAYKDDAQVVDQRSTKRYAMPGQEGVEVTIVAPASPLPG